MADPQKAALYRMEQQEFRAAWSNVKQPMKYLRGLAASICEMYKVPPVTLICRALDGFDAEYDDELHRVTFNTGSNARNAFTLAHEIAHHIVGIRYTRAQDHGPQFALIFGQVLSSMRLVPFKGWRAACKRHGVKCARWQSVH